MQLKCPGEYTARDNNQENADDKICKLFHWAPIRHRKLRLQAPQRSRKLKKANALMTSVTTLGKCTTDARALHTESITYEAKFGLLCKALQDNVLILGTGARLEADEKSA